jgi:diaminopimelate decarboxylase
MNHFEARAGELHCEDVPLRRIAQQVGTPVYVYSTATLERHLTVFRDAFLPRAVEIAYAVKANSNLSVLATLARLGAGADTVSEGEIRRALKVGIPAAKVVFSGAGKTRAELRFALEAGVGQINVESEPELDALIDIARGLGVQPAMAIRVNPDVGAGGHAKISTGKAENKFGVSLGEAGRLYAKAAKSGAVRPVALACHVGSQITDLKPLEDAYRTLKDLAAQLREQGAAVARLDLGGGLGVPYFNQPEPPPPAALAEVVNRVFDGFDIALTFEPGRVIAANAGVLVSEVIHVHRRPEGRRFLVLDAAMNDLIRPAMYDAYHDIRPVRVAAPDAPLGPYDVVGPICETGDTFTRGRMLPELASGDLVAFMSAGAYGAAMSSEYNTRPLVPEVLVNGAEFAIVRPRPSYDEMLGREPLAPWLAR